MNVLKKGIHSFIYIVFIGIMMQCITSEYVSPSLTPPVVTGEEITTSPTPTWTWEIIPVATKYRHSFDAASWTETEETVFTPSAGLPDGKHVLYVQSGDDLGNWSKVGRFLTVIDHTPPSAPLVTVTEMTNDTTPTWTWEATKDAVRFQYNFNNTEWVDTKDATTTSFTPSEALTEGSYSLLVKAVDVLDNWSDDGTATCYVDNTAPAVPVVTGETPTIDATPSWSWGAVDGAVKYQYSFDQVKWIQTSDTNYTPIIDLSDGTYTLSVRSKDQFGNLSEFSSFSITVDTVSSYVTLTNLPENPTNDPSYAIQVGGDGVTGYKFSFAYNPKWDEIEEISIVDFPTIEGTLDGEEDGTKTLKVVGKNAMGVWQPVPTEVTWSFDTTPPSEPEVSFIGSSPSNDPTPTWTWEHASATSILRYRYSYNQVDWVETLDRQITEYISSPIGDGTHSFYVQASDYAGNWSASGTASIVIDVTLEEPLVQPSVYYQLCQDQRIIITFGEKMDTSTGTVVGGSLASDADAPTWDYTQSILTISPISAWQIGNLKTLEIFYGDATGSEATITLTYNVVEYASIYVNDDDPNSNDDGLGTVSEPLLTIQAAFKLMDKLGIGKANIYVARGSYTVDKSSIIIMRPFARLYGGYDENFGGRDTNPATNGTSITDTSTSGSPSRIIDAGSDTTQATNAIVEGFTLTGAAAGTETCTIFCHDGSELVIKNCDIYGGDGTSRSYGIYTNAASPHIESCTIHGGNGGVRSYGIYAVSSYSPGPSNPVHKIIGNTIDAGTADSYTKGIVLDLGSSPIIENNIIYGGTGKLTVGVNVTICSTAPQLIDNTINGGNPYSAALENLYTYGILNSQSSLVLTDNIINAGVLTTTQAITAYSYGIFSDGNGTSLTLTGNTINGGTTSTTADNSKGYNYGISSTNTSLILTDNTITGGSVSTAGATSNAYNYGIYGSSARYTFDDNIITAGTTVTTGTGSWGTNYAIYSTGSVNHTINHNTINYGSISTAGDASKGYNYGFYTTGTNNHTITSNTFSGGSLTASIINSTAYNYALYFTGNNTVHTLTDNIINSGNITTLGDASIAYNYAISTTGTNSQITMSGNTLTNGATITSGLSSSANNYGLVTSGTTSHHTVSNNTFNGGTVTTNGGTSNAYIYLFNTSGTTSTHTLSNNTFNGSSVNTTGATSYGYIYGLTTSGSTSSHTLNTNIFNGGTVQTSNTNGRGYIYVVNSNGTILNLTSNTINGGSITTSNTSALGTNYGLNSNASLTLTNNSINAGSTITSGTSATITMYGTYTSGTGLTITNNTINCGTASASGASGTINAYAMYSSGSTLTLTNNTISVGTTTTAGTGSANNTYAVYATGGTRTISQNTITGGTASSLNTTSNVASYGIVLGGTTVTISNNTITGGNNSTSQTNTVSVFGLYNNTNGVDPIITGNTITAGTISTTGGNSTGNSYAFYNNSQGGATFPTTTDNTFNAGTSNHTGATAKGYTWAVYLRGTVATSNPPFYRNRLDAGTIVAPSTTESRGMEVYTSKPLMYNNYISGGTSKTVTGVYLQSTANAIIYNNTIDSGVGATNVYGILLTSSSLPDIRNNIIYNTGAGTTQLGIIEANANADPTNVENNDIYGFTTGYYRDEASAARNYNQLAAGNFKNATFTLATPTGANNVINNPTLDGNHRLNVSSPCVVSTGGQNLGSITDDLDSNARTNPLSIGAFEWDGGCS